jgi:transposase-like protein
MVEFMREYANDAACLDWLWRQRYSDDGAHAHCPKCDRTRKFHRVKDRPAYDCDTCGYHLHPTAGTIFHKSATSLHLWFYAMYLMASTRCGVSAKQLERELGVTYKTAWRMFNLIRNEVMADDDPTPLSGEVEVDETFIKGRMRNAERRQRAEDGVTKMNPHRDGTAIVYAAVERGGRVRATVIPDSRARTLLGQTIEYVESRSTIYTDQWKPYMRLPRVGYTHHRIQHNLRIYVDGDVHTQTVDGFFAMVKNAIRGVHHGVSHKWLQGYLNEYTWRYNRRNNGGAMFLDLLAASASEVR